MINKELHTFSHAVQSVRYLENQAKDRKGINVSIQVLEGILKHDTDIFSGEYETLYRKQHDCSHLTPQSPGSLESQVVYWADKIAYLSHDFEDFKRMGIYDDAIKSGKLDHTSLDEILSVLIKDTEGRETRDIIRNVTNQLIEGSIKNLAETNPVSSSHAIELTSVRHKERLNNNEKPKEAYQNSLIINFEENYKDYYKRLRGIIKTHYLSSPDIKRSDEYFCNSSPTYRGYALHTLLVINWGLGYNPTL